MSAIIGVAIGVATFALGVAWILRPEPEGSLWHRDTRPDDEEEGHP